MTIQAADSENNVPLASEPPRYNTRAATRRRALGDISNVARALNFGNPKANKRSKVTGVKRNAPDTENSILREDVVSKLEAQVEPVRPNIKHVLEDPIASEAYASSLKLPIGVVDIDCHDYFVRNHLAEATLAVPIQVSQITREFASMVDPEYLRRSNVTPRIRTFLVDWIVSIHRNWDLSPSTLFLTVNIFDRFVAINASGISRSRVPLVGLACLFIASKYEEIFHPCLDDVVAVSDGANTREEVLGMEALVCNQLNFVFTVPTSLPFLSRGLKAFYTMNPNADGRIPEFAHYALELALSDGSLLKYRPSMLAASAIALASYKLAHKNFSWDDTMRFHTGGYTIDDLRTCANELWSLIQRDCCEFSTKKRAVRSKYSTDKFKKVALIFSGLNSRQLYSNLEEPMDIETQRV